MKLSSKTRSFLLIAFLLVVYTACAVNPATGKRQLVLMGEQQEVQLGLENDRAVVASMGIYDDPELQRYVSDIGTRLAAVSERPDLDWHFKVVDDPTVNAFALPGGYIYVTRGILAHLGNEAELASVLGHEIGHVTARHGVNQMSKAQLANLGMGLGMVLSEDLREMGGLAQMGMEMLFLKYSRDDERQADDLGLRYINRIPYDPRPMPNVFETLRRVGEAGGSGRAPAWQQTHPAPERRSERIDAAIQSMGQDFSGMPVHRDRFLDVIDGMTFGPNPREGYFKDSRFLHPQLEFRMDFPSGWNTQNQKQAVVALSQEQNAIVQLTMGSKPTAAESLEAFFQQEGVVAGPAWKNRIGGYPAASRQFQVNQEQQVLRGTVAFVEYGGTVFQLIGFTLEDKWAAYGDTIAASLESFGRLTDRAALDVQPKRMRVVSIRTSMSLAELARSNGATVETDLLALINQVDPGARLAPGRYKVVTGRDLP